MYYCLISNIIMRYARIYPWRRTRRSRALWNGPDAFFVAQFLEGSTNMSGFDLRQGQAARLYWRWKSRPRSGRPTVAVEIRRLIREMSIANPLWGAPRIHGELLKLGVDTGQTSVAKYMVKRRHPPSQGWRTFIRNHADGIAAMDLFVVPTISFRLLYGLLIMGHRR